MRRVMVCAVAMVAMVAMVSSGNVVAQDKKQKKNNQMVKGTIKSVDVGTSVLVVAQQVGKEKVDRELSILTTTEFVVDGKEASGKEGLNMLVGKEGSQVQVKCDKDVQVLKVTVKLKK